MLKQGNTHTTDTVLLEPQHSHAICDEIGERLQVHLREEPELPANLRRHIDRLRELEGLPPSMKQGSRTKHRLPLRGAGGWRFAHRGRREHETFRNQGALLATLLGWPLSRLP